MSIERVARVVPHVGQGTPVVARTGQRGVNATRDAMSS